METPSPMETPIPGTLLTEKLAFEAYRAGGPEDSRTAVLDDLGGSIPEVPLSFFLDHVAPMQHSNISTIKVKKKLERKNTFTKKGRWNGFGDEPSKMTGGETAVFKPFEKAIQNIINACLTLMDSTNVSFIYFNNPNLAPYSERSNTGRPDGYFIRPRTAPIQRGESPYDRWDDIFGPTEYKKGSSQEDIVDNARKIIWSLQHIMSSDPRRRFAFGFTIENTNTQVWFCSRTDVFVTESFNFITASEHLIEIVSRMVSADEAGLGWDPTIIRDFDDGGKPYYDIVVHDKTSGEKTYRTSKILFSYGADPLRGRGTRVFEGRLLEDGMPSGHSVAIKDGWVDHDRKREATILADLYAEADEADKLLIEQYFLTVLAYGDVIVSGQIDHTRDLIKRGKDVPTSSQFLLTNLPPLRSTRGLSTLTYDDSALTRAQRATYRFSDKVHNRTVYKEVAAPIYTVKGLTDSFQVLQDTTIGLKLLHKYGIVHRDVSIGNVLEFGRVGKLADLEYAKKMDDKSSHEIRTGTLDFMPVEVDSQAYTFLPVSPVSPDFLIQETPPLPPFRQNYLHDLESVWWIAAFILFCCRDKSEEEEWSEQEAHQVTEQLQVVRQMFPRVLYSASRHRIFTVSSVFTHHIKHLPSAFLPVASRLDGARGVLVERYMIAEAGSVIDEAAFIGIDQQMIDVLGLARTLSGQTQLFSLFEVVKMLKRKLGVM